MPYVIPGASIDHTLVPSLPLGPFCEAYAGTIKSDLSKQRPFPFDVVVDGWMAAVSCFYCCEFQAGGMILQHDRIIQNILAKQISPQEIDLETMVVPLQATTGSVASRIPVEKVTIESWWDKLCYSKSREGPMDSLELKFGCPLIRNRRCLVQVRQPLPYSLTTNLNVAPQLGQFISVPKIGLVLPKSPVFFTSRLATLRHLYRVAQAFRDHRQDSKYEDVMIRISQVHLQMCIYYRSIKSTPPLFKHHTNLELWIQLVDQGDKAKDDIFDSWGLRQNYAFLSGLKEEKEKDSSRTENGKISLTEVWSKAAEWGCTGTTLSKVEVIKALEEMHKWLLGVFRQVKAHKRLRAAQAENLARNGSRTPTQSSFDAQSRR